MLGTLLTATASVSAADRDAIDALFAHPEKEVAEVIAVLRLSGLRSLAVVEDGVVLRTITEQDLIRALTRVDQDVADDIRCRLARLEGLGRWIVTVCGGDVVFTGLEPDPVERLAVTALTASVVGVMKCGLRLTTRSISAEAANITRPSAAFAGIGRTGGVGRGTFASVHTHPGSPTLELAGGGAGGCGRRDASRGAMTVPRGA